MTVNYQEPKLQYPSEKCHCGDDLNQPRTYGCNEDDDTVGGALLPTLAFLQQEFCITKALLHDPSFKVITKIRINVC